MKGREPPEVLKAVSVIYLLIYLIMILIATSCRIRYKGTEIQVEYGRETQDDTVRCEHRRSVDMEGNTFFE